MLQKWRNIGNSTRNARARLIDHHPNRVLGRPMMRRHRGWDSVAVGVDGEVFIPESPFWPTNGTNHGRPDPPGIAGRFKGALDLDLP